MNLSTWTKQSRRQRRRRRLGRVFLGRPEKIRRRLFPLVRKQRPDPSHIASEVNMGHEAYSLERLLYSHGVVEQALASMDIDSKVVKASMVGDE